MLTLYHAPMSRSSRIVTLIDELGALDDVAIQITDVPRRDGSGGPDPDNPHPVKQVPALDHDGTTVSESIAIAIHLCDLYPDAGLLPAPASAERGDALGWLAWYAGVIEPVLVAKLVGVENVAFTQTFRNWETALARLENTLSQKDFLTGRYSVADIILASPFQWMPDLIPDGTPIAAWVHRCSARPAAQRTLERDMAAAA